VIFKSLRAGGAAGCAAGRLGLRWATKIAGKIINKTKAPSKLIPANLFLIMLPRLWLVCSSKSSQLLWNRLKSVVSSQPQTEVVPLPPLWNRPFKSAIAAMPQTKVHAP
jgi:hypothetical protein